MDRISDSCEVRRPPYADARSALSDAIARNARPHSLTLLKSHNNYVCIIPNLKVR
jgi:hypothetical protein